jgi:hypothetical protein
MKLKIEVNMGNDAMQTIDEVRVAVHDAMQHMLLDARDSKIIRDENGNNVGFICFEQDPKPLSEILQDHE